MRYSNVEVEERTNLAKRNVEIVKGKIQTQQVIIDGLKERDCRKFEAVKGMDELEWEEEMKRAERKLRELREELNEAEKAVDSAGIHPDEYDEIVKRIGIS